MKNRLLILLVLLIFIFIVIAFHINRQKEAQMNDTVSQEVIIIGEDEGSKYTAKYNKNSFVYEVYDSNGNLLFVTPDKEEINSYVEDPSLVSIPNDFDV